MNIHGQTVPVLRTPTSQIRPWRDGRHYGCFSQAGDVRTAHLICTYHTSGHLIEHRRVSASTQDIFSPTSSPSTEPTPWGRGHEAETGGWNCAVPSNYQFNWRSAGNRTGAVMVVAYYPTLNTGTQCTLYYEGNDAWGYVQGTTGANPGRLNVESQFIIDRKQGYVDGLFPHPRPRVIFHVVRSDGTSGLEVWVDGIQRTLTMTDNDTYTGSSWSVESPEIGSILGGADLKQMRNLALVVFNYAPMAEEIRQFSADPFALVSEPHKIHLPRTFRRVVPRRR